MRRDEAGGAVEPFVSGCIHPAGGSPVPVSAGAPGSRSRVRGEIHVAQAGRHKPTQSVALRREQVRGPQHEVNPAASTESQSESRAAHVTAKATPLAQAPERAGGLGGVWGAARVQGWMRNTRGPSALPPSRQGASYKPKAKSRAAQRESEGLIVLMMTAKKNAVGGKGPCFGRAGSEGTREGMAGKTGPNNPDAHSCGVQVQQPQHQLWARAERVRPSVEWAIVHWRGDARRCAQDALGMDVVQALSGGPSVSRVREIRMHGLKGGPALSSLSINLNARKGRIYQ